MLSCDWGFECKQPLLELQAIWSSFCLVFLQILGSPVFNMTPLPCSVHPQPKLFLWVSIPNWAPNTHFLAFA